ncbi:MAG: flavin reductase family protein [Alphaproteobacteria bacterium]|nr:flavin reductase family protein [Alphaproteobacteria bacterium]
MDFDVAKIDPQIAYKLMTSTITPRPIAWVTSLSEEGVVNAAPYSFFNAMGSNPATVVVGLLRDPKKGFKDTAANIMNRGEFVVNLVPEALAPQMNITSMDAPSNVSELSAAGLTPRDSLHVAPPQIAESPVSFECVTHTTVVTGPGQVIAIGRVLGIRIDDAYILDAEKGYVDTPSLGMIGRMHGSGWYTRTQDMFQLDRPSYADWQQQKASNPQK